MTLSSSASPGYPPVPRLASDEELVAVLLHGGKCGPPPLRRSAALLASHGGLAGLARLGAPGLARLPDLAPGAAHRLAAAFELGMRCLERADAAPPLIASCADVVRLVSPRLAFLMHEQVWVVALNEGNHLLACFRIAEGGQHGCALLARDVLRAVLHVGASAFVLVHNHPGGDPRPSREDVHLTERVAAAAGCVGVPLLDHVIVTRRGHRSLLELGVFHPVEPDRRPSSPSRVPATSVQSPGWVPRVVG